MKRQCLVILSLGLILSLWPGRGTLLAMMRRAGREEISRIQALKDLCPLRGRRTVKGVVRPEELPESGSEDARLYQRYCGQCHGLPSPRAHSAKEWTESFSRMNARMQALGRGRMMRMCRMLQVEVPTQQEGIIILAYLQRNALRTLESDKIPFPTSRGARLFQETCSRCHRLPDIRGYRVSAWPALLATMEQYMEEEGLPPLRPEQRSLLLHYLERNARQ